MSIVPPRNFWPQPMSINLNGVLSAVPPLSITSTTMSIADASATSSGVVSTGAQTFAGVKNMLNGFTASTTQTITSISTDSTFATATDNELATKKAIKDYIATGAGDYISSVSSPLSVIAGNLDIADASALSDGIMTTGTQSINGAKTWSSDQLVNSNTIGVSSSTGALVIHGTVGALTGIFTGDDIRCDRAVLSGPCRVYSTVDGNVMQIYANNGAGIQCNSPLANGSLILFSGSSGLANFTFIDGLTSTNSFVISSTLVYSYRPTIINSSTTPQFTLAGAVGTCTFSVTSGDLTIDASGNDINMHSTDRVRVLNTTASSSKTTGALIVSGGVGVTGAVTSNRLIATGTTANPHLTLEYSTGQSTTMNVASLGQLTIEATGTTAGITLAANTVNAFTADPNYVYSRIGHEFDGAIKVKNSPQTYTPVGAGPFNNYAITDTDALYIIDLSSFTTGSSITGFAPVTYQASRIIEIIFLSTGGSKTVQLDHEAGTSSAANRLWLPNSSNLVRTVNPSTSARFFYSSSQNRWLLLSYT